MRMNMLLDPQIRRDYPPHGTLYETSGRAAVLGVAAPLLVDLVGLESGPLWLLPKRVNSKAALVIGAILVAGYLLCGVVPGFIAGWIVGASSVLAHTRSRIAIAVGIADAAIAGGAVVLLGAAALQERLVCIGMKASPVPGHFQCMGRVLDNIALLPNLLGLWEYLLVAAFMAATAWGAIVALQVHGHGFLYDEVAEAWYGKPVRIGGEYGRVDGAFSADDLKAPPPRSTIVEEPWVELYLHPTSAGADPARELVSARRVYLAVSKKGQSHRVEREEMPPTYVDAAIVRAIAAEGPRG